MNAGRCTPAHSTGQDAGVHSGQVTTQPVAVRGAGPRQAVRRVTGQGCGSHCHPPPVSSPLRCLDDV